MSMFVISKMNEIIERLERIEKLILERQPYSGAPAQRAYDKQTLLPKMAAQVRKEPKR